MGETAPRSRRWRAVRGLAVLLTVVAGLAACGGADERADTATTRTTRETDVLGRVIERPTTTSTARVTSTTDDREGRSAGPTAEPVTTSTTSAPVSPPVTAAPSTSTTRPTTTTVARCHPSDEDCDGWWWSALPGPNAPLELTVSVAQTRVRGEERALISVQARDPDALLRSLYTCVTAPDGSMQGYLGEVAVTAGVCLAPPSQCERPVGEVDPPPPTPDAGAWAIEHPTSVPGPYTIVVMIDSGRGGLGEDCSDPYGSSATASRTVTVV